MIAQKEEKTVVQIKNQKEEIKSLKRELKHIEKIAKLKAGTSKFITGFKQEMRKSIVTAVTAAFGFLVALVWRDVIVKIVNSNLARLGLSQETVSMQVYAAIIITAISAIGVMALSHWASN